MVLHLPIILQCCQYLNHIEFNIGMVWDEKSQRIRKEAAMMKSRRYNGMCLQEQGKAWKPSVKTDTAFAEIRNKECLVQAQLSQCHSDRCAVLFSKYGKCTTEIKVYVIAHGLTYAPGTRQQSLSKQLYEQPLMRIASKNRENCQAIAATSSTGAVFSARS
jgi:hypothetical protein